MKLPRIILKGLKKTRALERSYPKDKPSEEQIKVQLLLLANQEGACGFLVYRTIEKPSETGGSKDSFYEPGEILSALQDYNENTVLTKPAPPPIRKSEPKPWKKAPKLTIERKPIPQEEMTAEKKKFEKVTHPDRELQIGDIT